MVKHNGNVNFMQKNIFKIHYKALNQCDTISLIENIRRMMIWKPNMILLKL